MMHAHWIFLDNWKKSNHTCKMPKEHWCANERFENVTFFKHHMFWVKHNQNEEKFDATCFSNVPIFARFGNPFLQKFLSTQHEHFSRCHFPTLHGWNWSLLWWFFVHLSLCTTTNGQEWWYPIQGQPPVLRCPKLRTRERMFGFKQNLMPMQRSARKLCSSLLAPLVIDLQNLKTVTAFPIESSLLWGLRKSPSHALLNTRN